MKEYFPADFARLKKYVDEGRFRISAEPSTGYGDACGTPRVQQNFDCLWRRERRTDGSACDAALAQGEEVIGVIPQSLIQKEVAHTGLTDLRVVDSMH